MRKRLSSSPVDAVVPWYREPWPWLLIAGPLAVVLASMVTLWLAVRSDDGVVAGDYYKRGLLVNRRLSTVSQPPVKAATYIGFMGDEMVVVALGGDPAADTLHVTMVHAATGMRQEVRLMQDSEGGYSGVVPPGPAGVWSVSYRSSTLPTTVVERE